jgi:hypothetical protein
MMRSSEGHLRKLAAIAGMVGPLLFAAILLSLTLIQYPFMRSLGWDPIMHPTFDWPSGLALGPLGWIMTGTFLVAGALMSAFAWGLRAQLKTLHGQLGTILMVWAGVALMGLAFTTDRVITPVPISWHGRLHDLAFTALGLLLIPAFIMLALSFRETKGWGRLALFTWAIFALAVPTFTVKGFVFYAFLIAIFSWHIGVAVQLYRVKES